ncbi:MAG: hypothetical protein CVU71_17335 [Deltaproteobacteria bacterium HGW-Deltaproteobacteria-6]|jgi:hypothetical protein|nr:MAG: hypothetical protein CVU71_17335 [Deltaproteobacteria bacterium HGW-Deltaproteobacteria-6]
MKRFLVVLSALGLIAVFSTTVFAADIKISGEFYAAGMYANGTSLQKATGPSTAFYYQRLRVQTGFVVSPGLTLITRFDAMERAWGAARTAAGTALALDSAGTVAEKENFVIDWAYVNYKAPIGTFDVGYMNYGSTGTIFANNSAPQGRIKYSLPAGPVTINTAISKVKEKSNTAKVASANADADSDVYHLEGVYAWKTGRAGLNVNYYRNAENRPANNYGLQYYLFTPYAIAKIGPVALQTEINYAVGQLKSYDNNATNVDLQNWSGWLDATADLKMAYIGATIAYVSGDDPTTGKQEGGTINGGRDWNPCLIMFNYYDRGQWYGNLTGYDGAIDNGVMSNAWFFQGRAGVKPIDKLNVLASVSYAFADYKPAQYLNKDYGWEVDLTGTYKITNNLSYMLGVGYFNTGGYYKGKSDANNVDNNYLVLNKLTLTF